MRDIIIRLLKIPMYILWAALCLTIGVPIVYWVATGDSFSKDCLALIDEL